jgi:hypothetical protein
MGGVVENSDKVEWYTATFPTSNKDTIYDDVGGIPICYNSTDGGRETIVIGYDGYDEVSSDVFEQIVKQAEDLQVSPECLLTLNTEMYDESDVGSDDDSTGTNEGNYYDYRLRFVKFTYKGAHMSWALHNVSGFGDVGTYYNIFVIAQSTTLSNILYVATESSSHNEMIQQYKSLDAEGYSTQTNTPTNWLINPNTYITDCQNEMT